MGINLISLCHVENVCLLSNQKKKPDTHIDFTLDCEDYYRFKEAEKPRGEINNRTSDLKPAADADLRTGSFLFLWKMLMR